MIIEMRQDDWEAMIDSIIRGQTDHSEDAQILVALARYYHTSPIDSLDDCFDDLEAKAVNELALKLVALTEDRCG